MQIINLYNSKLDLFLQNLENTFYDLSRKFL